MSYYILPKNMNIINVNPTASNLKCNPYISQSFIHYYSETKTYILNMFTSDIDLSDNTFEDAIKLINPYEFIYSKVPGSNFSVSKLKPKSNIFYDLFEIYHNLHFFDNFKSLPMKSLHISPNFSDSIDCCELFREGYIDENMALTNLECNVDVTPFMYDYIFFECNTDNINDYFMSLINIIIFIFKNQNGGGNIIIKIKDMTYKPVIDCLYLLTSLYDKVYITKPNTSNIISHDKYIVCKSFQLDKISNTYLKYNFFKLIVFIKKMDKQNIISILDCDIPYIFRNKLDDLNIIIGQQQIEALDQIVNIFKNKHKNHYDKIESIKKSNIQKSVYWCEKHKIPCNKFTEKINIFLPIM